MVLPPEGPGLISARLHFPCLPVLGYVEERFFRWLLCRLPLSVAPAFGPWHHCSMEGQELPQSVRDILEKVERTSTRELFKSFTSAERERLARVNELIQDDPKS